MAVDHHGQQLKLVTLSTYALLARLVNMHHRLPVEDRLL